MIMNNTESINEKIIQNMIEITDFDAPELDVYARLTEAQLLNKDHPEDGLFIAESPKVISRALDGGYEPVSVLVEKKQVLEDPLEASHPDCNKRMYDYFHRLPGIKVQGK